MTAGDPTSASPPELVKRVDRVVIARYAAATGDYTRMHFEDSAAQQLGLPGVLAHGLLSLGYVGQALTELYGGDPARLRSTRLRFVKPVFPGDELRVRLTPGPLEGGDRHVRVEVLRGTEVVSSGQATFRD